MGSRTSSGAGHCLHPPTRRRKAAHAHARARAIKGQGRRLPVPAAARLHAPLRGPGAAVRLRLISKAMRIAMAVPLITRVAFY